MGRDGDSRVTEAAALLIEQPSITILQAMTLSKFNKQECNSRAIQKNISKKKAQVLAASHRMNNEPVSSSVTTSNRSSSVRSSLTSSSTGGQQSSGSSNDESDRASRSTKKSTNSTIPSLRDKALSQSSRRSTKQVSKFKQDRNGLIIQRSVAYAEALRRLNESSPRNGNNKKKRINIAQVGRDVSEEFEFEVRLDSLRKLKLKNKYSFVGSGRPSSFTEDDLQAISTGLLSWLSITQINGDAEKKPSQIISVLADLIKTRKPDAHASAKWLWSKLRDINASVLNLSKQYLVKLRLQMWTTFDNLSDWFDAWESFVLEYGFADLDENANVIFSEEQRRRIINLDRTNFSLDGSDGGRGGRGGRPACSVTVADAPRTGTATNKSSISSTLMCGSNAAGEPLPLHIMFSSDAQNEENYGVILSWIQDLPFVYVRFGHDSYHRYCATVTVNQKGGTDTRVLSQVLQSYVDRLYPDAADAPGKRVLIKIDGGPGRMDINSLAELRSRGIYLFPGVQNTTQLTQETDQNFGLFKSLLREYAHVFSNELFSSRDPSSKGTTTFYSALLSGRPPDPAKGTKEIPPIFDISFSIERNLKSWAKCGAVPLTRCILQHRSVRHEKGERGDDGYFAKFEDGLQQSIRKINAAGYNGSVFQIKIREKVASRRLGGEATREERAQELAKKMSLGHIFRNVGPQCLSVDEIFVSSELGENQKAYKKKLAEWTKLKARKDLELKAKLLLQQQDSQPNKKFTTAELIALLKWKTGQATQGMKVDELRNLWNIAKLQDPHEDIVLPPQPHPPTVQPVHQTALGRTIKRKFNEVVAAVEMTSMPLRISLTKSVSVVV